MARNNEFEIITAINAYYKEYQKYPVPDGGTGVVVFSRQNNLLFDVLRNRTGAKTGNPLNPHGTVFLNASFPRDDAHPVASIQDSTGVWYDPWGSPYCIAIDTSGKGELNGAANPIPGFYSDVGPLKADAIAWSLGKNGELGGGPASKPGFSAEPGAPAKYQGSGDVGSW
ncbi:MAG TPA: hypothetical protein VG733_00770 [Chthoniobacteraceae bacterium]|nr:hypothetical protein [Chthoniobacteraceae bacterium]